MWALCNYSNLEMHGVVGIVLSVVLIPALILWTWLLIPALLVMYQCPAKCWCNPVGTNINCANRSLSGISIHVYGTKKLTMDYNNITKLKRNVFLSNDLTVLEVFSANSCGIRLIEPGAFNGLVTLKQLFLKSNKLRDFHPFTFVTLANLEYLYLADNGIESLRYDYFVGLDSLRVVVLDRNKIKHIEPDAFKSSSDLNKVSLRNNRLFSAQDHRPILEAPSLEQLFLSGCNVSSLSVDMFKNLTAIKILDISRNLISKIDIRIMWNFTRLSRLYLSGNPLICDCKLQKVWEWSEDHNITTVSYLEKRVPTCSSPVEVSGLWWGVLQYANCDNDTVSYQSEYRKAEYVYDEVPDFHFKTDTNIIQHLQAALYAVLFVFGAFGNVILIFIITSTKEIRTEPNIYIFNLAVCDLLSLSTNLPISHVHKVLDYWNYGEFMCKFFMFCRRLTIGVSAYSVAILSMQRYIVTVDPFRNRTQSTSKWHVPILNVLAVWLLASAFALPSAFSAHAKTVCGNFYTTDYYQKVVIFELVVSCILPLCVIIVMYAMTARHLIRSVIPGQDQHSQINARMNIAKIVMSLVLVFVFSFVPYHVLRTYRYWNEMAYVRGLQYVWSLSSCILVFNSCFNPVALLCSSSSYRSILKRHLVCLCKSLKSTKATNESTSNIGLRSTETNSTKDIELKAYRCTSEIKNV